MNILAHLYLSGGINDIMFGNFIGDFVKGNQYLHYPEQIQTGIKLHRYIDSFTDQHYLHKQTRDRFRPKYRLFSGVVVDILYDHYLASNWEDYSKINLSNFAQEAYGYILNKEELLPDELKKIAPIMITNNWLELYKSKQGIKRVLEGMSRRTSLPNEVDFAMQIFESEYNQIKEEFLKFFSEMRSIIII